MAHNPLAEKLDRISEQDLKDERLNLAYDMDGLWDRLESRLDHESGSLIPSWSWHRMLKVACIACLLLLVPFTFFEKEYSSGKVAERPTPPEEKEDQFATLSDGRTGKPSGADATAEAKFASSGVLSPISALAIKKPEVALAVTKESKLYAYPANFRLDTAEKQINLEFAVEDISIIQASLEQATINDRRIESRRTMSVRAHWQPSVPKSEVPVKNQTLKINLARKSKSE